MSADKLPVHVAIIMDGNGRWAKKRGLPRIEGHKEGVKRAEEIIRVSREIGIRFLTLFAFSTENWQRPREEVDFLMGLLGEYLKQKEEELKKQDIRFNVIGRVHMLPEELQKAIEKVKKSTESCKSMILTLALSYGGRAEIVDAARKIAEKAVKGEIRPDEITEELFSQHLYSPFLPDPDLLIRTGGEIRISNFLLWELAYTELYFTPTLWPDFGKESFLKALEDYSKRERRFGRVLEP